MRQRDGMLSHAVEVHVGTGSNSQRESPQTSMVGGRHVFIEINVAGGGGIQAVDSQVDYRDRLLILKSQLLSEAYYAAIVATGVVLPAPAGPNNVSILMFPYEPTTIAATGDVGVFRSEMFYTALGWDGATLPRGTIPNQNFAKWIDRRIDQELEIYLYCDPFTGGLNVKNNQAKRYQGFLVMEVFEQFGALVTVL